MYIHFYNMKTGTIVLVEKENEEEVKRYQEDPNYYQYFLMV